MVIFDYLRSTSASLYECRLVSLILFIPFVVAIFIMVRVGGRTCLLAPILSFSACIFVLSFLPQAYGRSMCSILDQRSMPDQKVVRTGSPNY